MVCTKIVRDAKDIHIVTLAEASQILQNARKTDIYVEIIEVSPGKFFIPQLPPGLGATSKGKVFKNQGAGVYPNGTLGIASCTMEAALGAGGLLELGNDVGFMAYGTDNQYLVKYMDITHNDIGNNRILHMHYTNQVTGLGCHLADDTLTIAPTVVSPLYPRIRDAAGAYHPNGAAPFGPLIIDAQNWLAIELTDLANTFDIEVSIAYTIIVHE